MFPHNFRKMSGFVILAIVFLLGAAACVPAYESVVIGTETEGTTDDGLYYDTNDLLFFNTSATTPAWETLFDGEWFGLNDAKHDISAFSFNEFVFPPDADMSVEDVDEMELYLSFEANRARVPGVPGFAFGQDVVKFTAEAQNGTGLSANDVSYNYEMFFDGSDVGLTTNGEKIDGLSVWPPEYFEITGTNDVDFPYDCTAGVIFLSLHGNYRVNTNRGGFLVGDGSDVLAFCATNTGPDTAGFWFRVFDSSDAGFAPIHGIQGIDVLGVEFTTPVASDSGTDDIGITFVFVTGHKPSSALGGTFTGQKNNLYAASTSPAIDFEGPFTSFDDGVDGPAVNSLVENVTILDFTVLNGN